MENLTNSIITHTDSYISMAISGTHTIKTTTLHWKLSMHICEIYE